MTQYEAVLNTIERLGGIASLEQLNREVFKISECLWKTRTPFASIRRIVQLHKGIYKIRPGLYGSVRFKTQNEQKGAIVETAKNKDSKEVREFSHAYYQGLLLSIGRLRRFNTFSPNQDKSKIFNNNILGEVRTLSQLPLFSYQHLVKKASTIDVSWFNERNMPRAFFEVEHSTDIYNSLLKYIELQDFYAQFFIVADGKRLQEFKSKLSGTAFVGIAKRVQFESYDELDKLYAAEVAKSTVPTLE